MENQNHIRINNTILGPLERPALNWLADHMPAWVMPDHLTALGLLASLIIFSLTAQRLLMRAFCGWLVLASS